MLPTLESLHNAPPVDSGSRPLSVPEWGGSALAAVVIVAIYLLAFPIEYRHPIDVIDAVREAANFLGIVAVALWARRDIRVLNVGLAILLVSLWMEVVDEFTAEPHWIGTIVPAILGIAGIALVALGVREARRRREEAAERRSQAETALRRSLTTLRAVVESTPDAVWVKGADGRFMLVNTAYAALVGRDPAAIVGRAEAELYASRPDAPGRAVARALESGATDRFEATVADAGADARTFLVSRSAFKDEVGRSVGVLGIARDISDRKAVEEKLFKQAHHDGLTGLANRANFMEHLSRALTRFRHHRHERRFAVLYLDIDRFKDVNDRYGHAVGDEVLVAFAQALVLWVRPEDFVSRLGGDEFTVLLHEVADREAAVAVAERILEGLQTAFALSAGPVSITASVGVALSSPTTDSPDAMLRVADTAMYRAKELGRARHVMAGA